MHPFYTSWSLLIEAINRKNAKLLLEAKLSRESAWKRLNYKT